MDGIFRTGIGLTGIGLTGIGLTGIGLAGAALAAAMLIGVPTGVRAGESASPEAAPSETGLPEPRLTEPRLPQVAASVSPEAEGVAQMVTAANVAAWGRSHQDAGALIMAARILAEVPVRADPDATGTDAGAAAILTPGGLLDEAAVLSDGDQATLDAIAFLRNSGTRGVRSSPFGQGPIFQVREIKARETYGFALEARGGEVLRVAAIGDGDTNIDMVVRDEAGSLLCQDGFGDHYPVCTVAAAPTSGPARRMRIDIVNRGVVWTKVQILSN